MEGWIQFQVPAPVRFGWPMPPADWRLHPQEVHCWSASLDLPSETAHGLQKPLSEDELERASRFRVRHARHRFLVARGLLRRILASYTGIPAEDLQFVYGGNGKPALAPWLPQVFFNLSHSGSMALYAVASGCEVGIDVEQVLPIAEADSIAVRMFDPGDQALLRSREGRVRDELFYRTWTRKEAVLKCTGAGIGAEPAPFSGCVHEFRPAPDYVGAVAVASAAVAVRTWRWAAAAQAPESASAPGGNPGRIPRFMHALRNSAPPDGVPRCG